MKAFLSEPLPLEDGQEDVIEKAAWGRGLSAQEIAQKKVSGEFWQASFWESLGLNVLKMKALQGQRLPVALPAEVVQVSATLYESGVNAWGLSLPKGALMIDRGLSEEQSEAVASLLGLGASYPLLGIGLTHWHADHTGGRGGKAARGETSEILEYEIRQGRGLPLSLRGCDWVSRLELFSGASQESSEKNLEESPSKERLLKKEWQSLCSQAMGEGERVETELFFHSGHSVGGVMYALRLPHWGERWVLFSGDLLFARSLGRVRDPAFYEKTLAQLKELLLELPANSWILPGHGPATTVGEELAQNPFF